VKQFLVGIDLTGDTARETLHAGVADKISSILMIPREDVKAHAPLEDLGPDSSIEIELRNWSVREPGVSIPLIDIAHSSSVSNLADRVAAWMIVRGFDCRNDA
jgi:hypothetical protein